MRKAVVACACVGLSVSAVCAADFYWTGAANDQMATNRLNWADADGQPVAAAPTHEDTVIFNLTTSDKTVYKYSNRTDYEYRKLILRGKKKLTFYGYGDCPTNMNQYIDSKGKAQGYAFYLPIEVVNESDGGTLLFSGKDPRVDRGSPEHYATNVFHVANANATIQNSNHIQTGDAYHKVIKTGPGKLIPYGGHNYDVRNFTIQEGTIAFSTHAQRSWWNCGLVFWAMRRTRSLTSSTRRSAERIRRRMASRGGRNTGRSTFSGCRSRRRTSRRRATNCAVPTARTSSLRTRSRT